MESKAHWENIYQTKKADQVSWFQSHLAKSLEFILELGLPKDGAIIDVGAGASTLPDDLLAKGFRNITVLDISAEALEVSKNRLVDKAKQITWLEADITNVPLKNNHYQLWHDRAVFHFLTNPKERKKYTQTLKDSLLKEGYALIATFGPNGPLKCSGLEIVRYSSESLQRELKEEFELKKHFLENHKTPFETTQEFLYCLFQKK
ncbi:MAG: class I SAM-dependent methyltransferase [Candidatus Omnitrophota bacterium]|nr:class I SAM-dependent methyltransferase [Candidatus Omnitrophota bacterium]